jgi:hypothetical protein
VRDFLRVRLGGLEHEVFAVLMLDAQHALIEYVELFRGSVSQTSVSTHVRSSRNRWRAMLVRAHPLARSTRDRGQWPSLDQQSATVCIACRPGLLGAGRPLWGIVGFKWPSALWRLYFGTGHWRGGFPVACMSGSGRK